MKKLSGLIALLAIVFAVSSAFTSKATADEWFKVKSTVTLFDDEQTQELATRSNYEDQPLAFDPRGTECSSIDTEKVCALEFDEVNVVLGEITQYSSIAFQIP